MSNFTIMTDTKKRYESDPVLVESVKNSIQRQYMVLHEEDISQPVVTTSKTVYVCSGKRSFEAAKAYRGMRTAVLNFANNRFVGGSPFIANAQEESLCRCSTLLPCLEAMREPFYNRHRALLESGGMNFMGNDDLIFTPDVVVFKTDERTEPICPVMMPQEEWYTVGVITSAAPELCRYDSVPADVYEGIIHSRIKKILDVAAKEDTEALILGKWGCGVFGNDPKVVSKVFYTLLRNYDFRVVEFALATKEDVSDSVWSKR